MSFELQMEGMVPPEAPSVPWTQLSVQSLRVSTLALLPGVSSHFFLHSLMCHLVIFFKTPLDLFPWFSLWIHIQSYQYIDYVVILLQKQIEGKKEEQKKKKCFSFYNSTIFSSPTSRHPSLGYRTHTSFCPTKQTSCLCPDYCLEGGQPSVCDEIFWSDKYIQILCVVRISTALLLTFSLAIVEDLKIIFFHS